MGFDNVHPENYPKIKKFSKDEKRKIELANKLIRVKKLPAADKAEIHRMLTGHDYSVKRGRPPEAGRNFDVTVDFLYLLGSTENNAKQIMRKLAIEYNLPGTDNDDNTEREITDVNFNKIVVQQLHNVESCFTQYIDAVDNGMVEDNGESYNISKICLQGLEKYKIDGFAKKTKPSVLSRIKY